MILHQPRPQIGKNSCSNLAWNLVYRVRNILKEDDDRGGVNWSKIAKKGNGTGPRSASWNSMKLHIPFRRGQRRWFEYQRSLALFHRVDSSTGISTGIGEAKGETKLSLIFRYRLLSLPPRKTARNESDTRGQRSKRSPSFGSAIFQFSKSNYLTIRRCSAGGGYFIKTCNPIQKRGRR